jgi:ATP-binding cassette, subfamily B, bacterial
MNFSTFHLVRRTLVYSRPFWIHIMVLFILGLLSTPIALLKPLPLKIVIDNGFGNLPVPSFLSALFPVDFVFSFQSILLLSVSLIIVTALIENINMMAMWVLETFTGERIVLNLRSVLFNHIQRLSLSFHDSRGISHSLFRIQWDTMSFRSFLLGSLSQFLASIVTLLAMLFIMFSINWRFALIAMCVIPPMFFLTRLSTKRIKKDWKKVKNDENLAMTVIHEALASLRVVKAFGGETNEQERFTNQSDKAVRGQLRIAWTGSFFYFLIGILFAIGSASFIYVGANFVKSGQMTLGELTLVTAYLAQLYSPLQSISKNLNNLQSSLVSLERVFEVLDQEKEVKEHPQAVHLTKAKGQISFRDVTFAYNQGTPILHHIDFVIKAGDRVGIMGSTGAGKSTLISLLMRFYDVSDGSILIDGDDIRKFKLTDYRSQFSLVLQDPVLFSTSIGENIRYGRPEATEKEIIEAAKAANAHDFIIKSKDGYDTEVGERGMQLSGGERQRISLARAFIKNAPVLILDEPTSSVDLKTEELILDAMERLMKGRTTFMITHRLNTLDSCNVILHLENGRLMDIIRDCDEDFSAIKKKILLKSK